MRRCVGAMVDEIMSAMGPFECQAEDSDKKCIGILNPSTIHRFCR